MLRRKKAAPAPGRPEPIDPSTIPEARPKPAEDPLATAAGAPVTDPDAPAAEVPVEARPEVEDVTAVEPEPAIEEAPVAEVPEVPETPDVPEVPDVPETPDVPEVPETPEVPEVPDTPDVPAAPEVPEVPDVPQAPDVPEVPGTGEAPGIPTTMGFSGEPEPVAETTPEPTLPPNLPPPLPDPPVVDSPLPKVATPPAPKPFVPPVRSTLPPSAPLAPSRGGSLVGGIDLGGTKIAAAVIGPNHEVVSYRRRPTPDSGGPADVVRAMATTMQEAAQDAGVEAHHLRGVGVGSPGAVDTETGAVSGAGNLPGWDGRFQLGLALREAIGTPVKVGNDVAVATDAEYRLGVGQEYDSLLGVFWGTGVGGGLILNGKPWHGRGKAGEIGHMVVKIDGARCGCGNRGCMEAYAGRKSMEAKAIRDHKKGKDTDLFKLAEKHGKPHLTSAIWAKALEHEDPLATKLLDRAVKALSAGIASAINLTDIDAVVIGGGLGIRFGDTLVPKIVEGMNEHLFSKDNPPPVKVAALGDEGGVIGASLLLETTV